MYMGSLIFALTLPYLLPAHPSMKCFVHGWNKLKNGKISKEKYDEWRYKYPELDTYQKRAKVPSQELSDYLVKELTKKENRKTLPIFNFVLMKISKVSLYTL